MTSTPYFVWRQAFFNFWSSIVGFIARSKKNDRKGRCRKANDWKKYRKFVRTCVKKRKRNDEGLEHFALELEAQSRPSPTHV